MHRINLISVGEAWSTNPKEVNEIGKTRDVRPEKVKSDRASEDGEGAEISPKSWEASPPLVRCDKGKVLGAPSKDEQ